MAKIEPPCDECKKPKKIDPKNLRITQMWDRCNSHEREYSGMSGMPKRLKTIDILSVCELYNCTRDDLENILLVESVVFPFIFNAAKERSERKK